MRKIKFLFTAMLAAVLVGCNGNGQPSGAVSFDDVIASRRSVRSYDATKTISEAEVRELLTLNSFISFCIFITNFSAVVRRAVIN